MIKWKLPNYWGWIKLGDMCTTMSGGTPSRRISSYFQGVIPWLKSGELNDSIIYDTEEFINEEALQNSSAKLLPNGTLLIAMYGATVGKLGILGVDATTNQAVCAIFPNEDILRDYIFWHLRFRRDELLNISIGGAQPNISQTIVKSIDIPIPYPNEPTRSLAEQQRIISRINSLFVEITEMRGFHDQIVSDTGQLMGSFLADTFSSRNRGRWVNENQLGEIAEINSPLIDPTLPEYQNLPHINGERIEEGSGRLLPYLTAAEDGMTSGKYHFQPGVVLYSKIRPYLQKVAIADFEGICSADMYPLEIGDDRLTPDFLKWALLSPHFTNYANELSQRARMPKLNRTQLFSYRIRYPNQDEQERITTQLSQVQSEITQMQEVNQNDAENIKQLEQAILAQAFRGEL